jgi:CelD/BcsL family acetyltransferase involved in cellulose biosynthesis
MAVFDDLAARRDWDVVELRAIPAASPSRAAVAALAAARGWMVEESLDDVCPVIALPATWDAYLRNLRKKDRHELRRKTGRLESAAEGERFAMIGPEDDLPRAIDDFFRLHRLSGQEKEGFWTEALHRFFKRLIVATHADGSLRLAFQSIGEQRVACVLSFRYGDRYYVYNSGYDPDFRAYAVGVVTMGRVIQAAIAEGAAVFDLLQGDEPYKYDFGAVNTEVYRLLVRPNDR